MTRETFSRKDREEFFAAIKDGDNHTVEAFIKAGYPLDQRNEADNTELACCFVYRQPAIAEFLLNNGADPDASCHNGGSALLIALKCGYDDFAARMIARGACFDEKAANKKDEFPAKFIRNNKMPLSYLAMWRRMTPEERAHDLCHEIVRRDNFSLLKRLVEKEGADVLSIRDRLQKSLEDADWLRPAQTRAYLEALWKEAGLKAVSKAANAPTARPVHPLPRLRIR